MKIQYILFQIKLIVITLLVTTITSCEKEECGYTIVLDCPALELNIGDACDSNGDGTLDGTVNDVCECIENPPPFECPELELNIGDECDSNGDGMLDGTVNDDCDCIDTTFPFACSEGMDVAFLIDYTGSMGGAIDGIKADVSTIASSINSLSLGNYQLSLGIFDEQQKEVTPAYFNQPEYTSLPSGQKIVVTTGANTDQYLTMMETFSLGNQTTFSSQLAKLNGPMALGSGLGIPEPGGLLINEVLEPNTFAGTWRSTNITKLIIIITDAPAGGDDDMATSLDDTYLQGLATAANPGGGGTGTQVILVSSLATSNYEIHLVDNNTGGLKLMNANFNNIADDIINLLEEVCMNNEM